MCYTAHAEKDLATLLSRFALEDSSRFPQPEADAEVHDFESAFNRPWMPVIASDHAHYLQWKRWGLVPSFGQDYPAAFLKNFPTYNAVSEKAASTRSFKSAWEAGRRCLIPVRSFTEYQHRSGGKKVPYRIRHKTEPIFSLAGLYEGETFTVLTTAAPEGSLMAEINNSKLRQPCIIERAFEMDWLNANLSETDVKRFCEASWQVEFVAETDDPEQQQSRF